MLPKHGFALGTMHRVGPDHTDTSILPIDDGCSHHERMRDMPRCHSPAGKGWEARWFRQQVSKPGHGLLCNISTWILIHAVEVHWQEHLPKFIHAGVLSLTVNHCCVTDLPL